MHLSDGIADRVRGEIHFYFVFLLQEKLRELIRNAHHFICVNCETYFFRATYERSSILFFFLMSMCIIHLSLGDLKMREPRLGMCVYNPFHLQQCTRVVDVQPGGQCGGPATRCMGGAFCNTNGLCTCPEGTYSQGGYCRPGECIENCIFKNMRKGKNGHETG